MRRAGASGSSCRCVEVSRGLCCLEGLFGWLVAPSPPAAARSRPAVRYFLDLSSVEPVPLCGTLHGFPYSRVFYNGVSGPPRGQQSPYPLSLSSFPDTGGLSSFRPGPSVCLTDPSLAGTLRSGASYGSFLACLHHDSHRERKAFLTALTRLLAMIGSLPHRSHAHRQLSVPFTLQQAGYISSPSPIVAGAAHLTLGGLRRSPHLLPILYISLASGSSPGGPI